MRIVGGAWRGRRISAPSGAATRPTTDRVREALFSALSARLGNELGEAQVLDAFAGSGALGLEALSRGASSVDFVEGNRRALLALRTNIESLGASSRAVVHPGDVFSLAKRGMGTRYSLILLDPPYTLDQSRVADLLDRLARARTVAQDAYITWEHGPDTIVVWPQGYRGEATKSYGDTEIDIGVYEGGIGE